MSVDVLVTDLRTGERRAVSSEQFDPELHRMDAGQVVAVDPSATGVAYAGQEVTGETIEGGLFEEVSPERQAAATQERVLEELYETPANITEQAIRGGVSGATLGLSELMLASDDPFERERQRLKREQAGGVYAAGELLGGVLPGVLTGGAGAAGVVARMTPAARLAARAEGVAAIGRPGVRRAVTRVAGGAFEGAVSEAGSALAEEALQDRPWSAEAIGARVLSGALLGGAGTGLVAGASKAAAKSGDVYAQLLTRGDDAAGVGSAAGKLDVDAERFAEQAARALDDAAGAAEADPTAWRRIFTDAETAPGQIGARASDVVGAVDRSADVLRAARRRRRDLASDATLAEAAAQGVTKDAADAAVFSTRAALDDFARAKNEANRWARKFVERAGGESKLGAGKLPPLLGDDADEAVRVLSRFDAARLQLDQALDAAEDVLRPGARQAAEAARMAREAAGELPVEAPAKTGLRGLAERAKERLAGGGVDVLAGAELVGEVTGVKPSGLLAGVPVVGELTGLYLKYRGLRNALGRVGGLGSSAATRAAAQSAEAGNRLRQAALGATRRVARTLDTTAARSVGARGAAALGRVFEDLDRDDGQAEQAARAETRGLPPEIADGVVDAALRARSYLQENRPPGSKPNPFSDVRTVAPSDARDFGLRVSALEGPDGALDAVLAGAHPRPTLAVEAIRAVYPQIYGQIQADLLENLDAIIENQPESWREQMGQLFDLPLTRGLMPGAPRASEQPAKQPSQPAGGVRRAGPSVNSKMAALSKTSAERRAMR